MPNSPSKFTALVSYFNEHYTEICLGYFLFQLTLATVVTHLIFSIRKVMPHTQKKYKCLSTDRNPSVCNLSQPSFNFNFPLTKSIAIIVNWLWITLLNCLITRQEVHVEAWAKLKQESNLGWCRREKRWILSSFILLTMKKGFCFSCFRATNLFSFLFFLFFLYINLNSSLCAHIKILLLNNKCECRNIKHLQQLLSFIWIGVKTLNGIKCNYEFY